MATLAWRFAPLAFCGGLLGVPHGATADECPMVNKSLRSIQPERPHSAKLQIINKAELPLNVIWVNHKGEENQDSSYDIDIDVDDYIINTHTGHSFRVYADLPHKPLLREIQVKSGFEKLTVQGCDSAKPIPFAAAKSRETEFVSLVHNQQLPCEPANQSSKWSCIRPISSTEYNARPHDGRLYGFSTKEEASGRGIGTIWDTGYVSHIPQIPRFTNGTGFLKMSWSQQMKDILVDFYNERKKGGPKDSVKPHEPIPGGYTNNHVIHLSKLDLTPFRRVMGSLVREMKDYLEWWTGRRLHHTATFGIRIYHRDSMLIDHVDRADTHLASAVIQVAQEVDEDGGWPLEVIDQAGNCYEVFLQPQELVLYEGGRFRHGRPMRLKGTSFANLFSHFAPADWHGPGKSPKYDGHLDENGYLRPDMPFHIEI